jgi:phosphotriesterase-related protein
VELGPALVGEQLVRGLPGYGYWESDEQVAEHALDAVVGVLERLRALGVETVVDTTPIECGRNLALLGQAADRAGVRVVASTGVGAAESVPAAFRSLAAERLADVYVAELAGAAAAITLGAGRDDGLLLAASFAHAETGAPVVADAEGEDGGWQAERLLARGVDPERILVAGLDRPDVGLGYLDRLARLGVRLGFTRLGTGSLDPAGAAALVAYVARRYGAERVCLAAGEAAYEAGSRNTLFQATGGLPPFADRLRELGLSFSDMLVPGPASLFA